MQADRILIYNHWFYREAHKGIDGSFYRTSGQRWLYWQSPSLVSPSDKRCIRRPQRRFCWKESKDISGGMETRKYSDHAFSRSALTVEFNRLRSRIRVGRLEAALPCTCPASRSPIDPVLPTTPLGVHFFEIASSPNRRSRRLGLGHGVVASWFCSWL